MSEEIDAGCKSKDLTTIKVLNINEPVELKTEDTPEEQPPAAVNFEVLNLNNCLVERQPVVALSIVEIRLALAMSFLEFREKNDRL